MPPKKRGRGAPTPDPTFKSNTQTRKSDPCTTSHPPPLQSTSSAPPPAALSTAQSLTSGPTASKAVEKLGFTSPTAAHRAASKTEAAEEKIPAPGGSTASSQLVGPQSESAGGSSESTGGKSNLKKKVVKKVVRKLKKPCLTGGTEPELVDANSNMKMDVEIVNPIIDKTIAGNLELPLQTSTVEAIGGGTQVVPMEVLTSTSEPLTCRPELNTRKPSETTESDITKGKVKKVIRKVIKKKIVKKMVPKGTLAAKKVAEAALSLAEEQAKSGDAGTNKAGEEIEKSIICNVNPCDNAWHTKEEIEFMIGENSGDRSEKSTEREGSGKEILTSEIRNKKDGEVNKEIVTKMEGGKEKNIKISTDSVNGKEISGEFEAGEEIQKQKADCSTSNNDRKVRKVIKKKIVKKLVPKGTLLAKKSAEENLNVSAVLEAENCNRKSEETLIRTYRPVHQKASSNSATESEQAQAKELTVSNKESPKSENPKHCSNAETQKEIEIKELRKKQKTTLPVKQHAKETATQVEKPDAEYAGPNKEEEISQQGSMTTMTDKMSQINSSSNVGAEEMDGLTERQKRRKTEIFIGGLDKEVAEMDIRTVFEKVGEIVEVRMFKENNTGKNKGYCFLRYKEPAQARKAISSFSKVEVTNYNCCKISLIDDSWSNITMFSNFAVNQ
jgi:RNA recognition motif. (a.k.a. RRM, RBD, or RNP domain)